MSACPYCFTELPKDQVVFRCVGRCSPRTDEQAERYGRRRARITPLVTAGISPETKKLPTFGVCQQCSQTTSLEVCPTCHRDLQEGWRGVRTFTMTVTGARGSGKSVYIAVLIDSLKRYAVKRRVIISEVGETASLYERNYYERVFDNKALAGTLPGFDDVMMWKAEASSSKPFYIIVRDVAGEDVEKLTAEPDPRLSFIDRADLTLFLFDPLMLQQVKQRLDGVIASVDDSRLGDTPEKALPKVLAQMGSGHARLAMVVAKFDSLHALGDVGGADALAQALANPAAHYNWDQTVRRAEMDAAEAAQFLDADTAFLDAELRGLLSLLGDPPVTIVADEAAASRKLAEVRHFAVSSVGDSARHADQLTLRGISPFRILDPVLWGLQRSGYQL